MNDMIQFMLHNVMQNDVAQMSAMTMGGYMIAKFILNMIKIAVQVVIICVISAGGLPILYKLVTVGLS